MRGAGPLSLSEAGRSCAGFGPWLGLPRHYLGWRRVDRRERRAFLRPACRASPLDWSPESARCVGAVFWPVALFVAIEILARDRLADRPRGSRCASAGCCRSRWSPPWCPTGTCPGCSTYYGEDAADRRSRPARGRRADGHGHRRPIATGARRAGRPKASHRASSRRAGSRGTRTRAGRRACSGHRAGAGSPDSANRHRKRQPSAAAPRVASAVAPRESSGPSATRRSPLGLGLSEATVKRHRRQAVVQRVDRHPRRTLKAA